MRLWENGFGFVMPPEVDPAAIPATRATLEMIAKLEIRLVIPGPRGSRSTTSRARSNVPESASRSSPRTSRRIARHALKVNLMFALLDKQQMPVAGMAAYLDRVEIYREFNALYFQLPPARLAELLVGELVKAGRRADRLGRDRSGGGPRRGSGGPRLPLAYAHLDHCLAGGSTMRTRTVTSFLTVAVSAHIPVPML
jgi:hypothetical protein